MFIFRAVNIYPSQIDSVLSKLPGIGSEYQVILERGQDGKDTMTVRVERAADASATETAQLGGMVQETLKKKLLVTPEVDVTAYGSLPRSERKTKRVFDKRD
jgi:phenylacetate-CoA ligase